MASLALRQPAAQQGAGFLQDRVGDGPEVAASVIEAQENRPLRYRDLAVERGRELLESSGIDIITATDLADAAAKAVEAVGAKA